MLRYVLLLLLAGLSSTVFASTLSIGPNGIRSTGLRLPNGFELNGKDVGVGQVEDNRAGKPGYDTEHPFCAGVEHV